MESNALWGHHQPSKWFFHTWAPQNHMANIETCYQAPECSIQLTQSPWTCKAGGSGPQLHIHIHAASLHKPALHQHKECLTRYCRIKYLTCCNGSTELRLEWCKVVAHCLCGCWAQQPPLSSSWWWQTVIRRFGASRQGCTNPLWGGSQRELPSPLPQICTERGFTKFLTPSQSWGCFVCHSTPKQAPFWGQPLCLPTLPVALRRKKGWQGGKKGESQWLWPLLLSVLIITAHPLSTTFSFCTNN